MYMFLNIFYIFFSKTSCTIAAKKPLEIMSRILKGGKSLNFAHVGTAITLKVSTVVLE